ncbi:hypothetical protein C8F01DRAFT_1130807 [Mycena amicta]|nr:hypothetical protein C8F01DRAFT_1130807 [Mycena amicta]
MYGTYCVLFARATQILLRRIRLLERQAPLFIAIILLFLLSTGQIFILTVKAAVVTGGLAPMPLDAVNTASLLAYVSSWHGIPSSSTAPSAKRVFFASVCSDALLIYRCLLVWDNNYYVIAPPIVLLICSTVFGYLQDLRTFQILSLTTAISVILLTVSRVACAAYKRRDLLSSTLRRKYIGAGATILESGAIYAIFVSIHFGFFTAQSPISPIIFAAVAQIVGIAPTVILVRAGLPTESSSVSRAGSGSLPKMSTSSGAVPMTPL